MYIVDQKEDHLAKMDEVYEKICHVCTYQVQISACIGWGLNYLNLALKLEKPELYEVGIAKYDKALKTDPSNEQTAISAIKAYNFYGNAINDMSKLERASEITYQYVERTFESLDILNITVEWLDILKQLAYKSPNPQTYQHMFYLGSRILEVNHKLSVGYRLKAEGLLGLSAYENAFEKNKSKIEKCFRKLENLDDTPPYNNLHAYYYAMLLGEEHQAYYYLKNEIETVEDIEERRQNYIGYMQKNPCLKNLRHNREFKEFVKSILKRGNC